MSEIFAGLSDTVAIALITLISGIAGTITGVISSYITTKSTSKSEMQKVVLEQLFHARLEAFRNFNVAYEAWTKRTKIDNVLMGNLLRTFDDVLLVSSNETAAAFEEFRALIYGIMSQEVMACKDVDNHIKAILANPFGSSNKADFDEVRIKCRSAMRADLIHIQVPSVKN